MQKNKFYVLSTWWRSVDKPTVIAFALLFAFSLILVTTASPAVASRIGLEEFYFTKKHIIYLIFAAFIIFTFSFLSSDWIKRIAIVGFLMSVALIILVQFYGHEVKGARRWLNFGGISIQPSEFMKPCFSVVVAWLLSLKKNSNFPSVTIIISLYLVIAFALIAQPDLGMLIMTSAVLFIQFFVAGLPLIWIGMIFISALVGITTAYFTLPHVAQRIKHFLDPNYNENYQVSKSIMAFERGGLYGCGPGEGAVKQVIPDCHADFIFSVAGEEFGIITCIIIAAIFIFIVVRGLLRSIDEENKYIYLSIVGLLSQFGLQAVINMGVTVNLLPTKGMTLPFISYGGSSTIAIAFAMGMLLAFTKKKVSLSKYKMRIIQ